MTPSLAIWMDALSLLAAASVGALAQRHSVCHVRAIEALWRRRDLRPLQGQTMAVAFAMLAAALASAGVAGVQHAPVPVAAGAVPALIGGLLFGVGAAANGGCSVSTLNRLAQGEGAMVATLAGFVLGVVPAASLQWTDMAGLWPVPTRYDPAWLTSDAAPWRLFATFTSLWLGSALVSMKLRGAALAWREVVAHLHLRGMAPLGVLAGLLYAVQGPWAYTGTLRDLAGQTGNAIDTPMAWRLTLAAALLAGVVGSAWRSGAVAWRTPSRTATLQHLLAGMLMGISAALVGGGNDSVLLNQLPMGAPAALLAWPAMCAGIAVAMAAQSLRAGAG